MSLKEDEMLMSNSFYHKDLRDTQWNRIKDLFPKEKKVGRRPLNPRKVFDGILWIFTLVTKSALILKNEEPKSAFPIKSTSRRNTASTPNFTSNVTLSNVFFSGLRIIVTSPLDTISWLSASSILFYLLLPSFTFSLPTTPRKYQI